MESGPKVFWMWRPGRNDNRAMLIISHLFRNFTVSKALSQYNLGLFTS